MQSLYRSLYAELIKMSTLLLIIFPLLEIAEIYASKVMSLYGFSLILNLK